MKPVLRTPVIPRRTITLTLAALLAVASAVPAFAQSEDKLTGLDRARQATSQALELAADDGDETPPATPPGQARGKSDIGRPGMGNSARGNSDRVTGRDRAAQAIAAALKPGNGNGNGFGHGHSAEVIERLLLDGEAPATLEAEENHGAEVTAMVKAYNELKAQERTDR